MAFLAILLVLGVGRESDTPGAAMPSPFVADFEETRVDKTQKPPRTIRRSGSLARDGHGCIRQDVKVDPADGGEALLLATISDPRTGAFVLLDAGTNRELASITPEVEATLHGALAARVAALAPESGMATPSLPEPSESAEAVADETVEGIVCRVQRWRSGEGRAALWFADVLGQAIRRERRSLNEDYDYRLFNIRLGEPPPSLFVVKKE